MHVNGKIVGLTVGKKAKEKKKGEEKREEPGHENWGKKKIWYRVRPLFAHFLEREKNELDDWLMTS